MFKRGIVEGESSEVDSEILKCCGNRRSQNLYILGLYIMCFNFNGNFQMYIKE